MKLQRKPINLWALTLCRAHCSIALAASVICTPAIAQNGPGPSPKRTPPSDSAFWHRVWIERQPISSFSEFPAAAGKPTAYAVDDADATRAINIVISRRSGTFTDTELNDILAGMHVDQLSALDKQGAGSASASQGSSAERLSITLSHIFLASPDRAASNQLIAAFSPYFSSDLMRTSSSRAFTGCNFINETYVYGFRCPATSLDLANVAPSTTEPFEVVLAKMSNDAYQIGKPQLKTTIDGYNLIGGPIQKDYGFAALVFASGNTLIVAIRGTERELTGQELRNGYADLSFASHSNEVFLMEVTRAVELLERANELYPNAKIYLTGHSLGGAIAQILAARSGLPAITFNSPGVSGLLSEVGNETAPLGRIAFANRGPSLVYATHGDPFSLIGSQTARMCTIEQVHPVDWTDVGANHSMDTMEQNIQNKNLVRYPGFYGPPTAPVPQPGVCPSPQ